MEHAHDLVEDGGGAAGDVAAVLQAGDAAVDDDGQGAQDVVAVGDELDDRLAAGRRGQQCPGGAGFAVVDGRHRVEQVGGRHRQAQGVRGVHGAGGEVVAGVCVAEGGHQAPFGADAQQVSVAVGLRGEGDRSDVAAAGVEEHLQGGGIAGSTSVMTPPRHAT